MRGTVKKWVRARGYGFIEPEEGGEDILVHHSDLGRLYELKEGQKVEFEAEKKGHRFRVTKVKIRI